MILYSIEIRHLGTAIKFVSVKAKNALQAINNVSSLYPVGPYEFIARRV